MFLSFHVMYNVFIIYICLLRLSVLTLERRYYVNISNFLLYVNQFFSSLPATFENSRSGHVQCPPWPSSELFFNCNLSGSVWSPNKIKIIWNGFSLCYNLSFLKWWMWRVLVHLIPHFLNSPQQPDKITISDLIYKKGSKQWIFKKSTKLLYHFFVV